LPEAHRVSEDGKAAAISFDDAREQLARVLSSSVLEQAPRLREFLKYVVDETLSGRSRRLKGIAIAQDVFKRDDVEEAQSSGIVPVEARRLRRRLDEYYAGEGKSDPIRISIPKGGYVPDFELRSQESPGEFSAPASNSEASEPQGWLRNHRPSSTFSVAALVVVGLLGLFFLAQYLWLESQFDQPAHPVDMAVVSQPGKPAIAVLPFEGASDGLSRPNFAKGLTEEIVTELSKLPGIDVIAMASILTIRGKGLSLQQIGKDLVVSHILRGTVRRTKEKIRVTSQLYNTKTGKQVWAERYDRQLQDEFVLSSELAVTTSEQISTALGETARQRQGSRSITPARAEARTLYKQALALRHPVSDPGRVRIAIVALERVIEIDPTFAGGYAGLAFTYAMSAWWGHSRSPDEDIRTAMRLAKKALEIDPSRSLAFSAITFSHYARREFDKALASSTKAVSLHPSSPAVNARHGFLFCTSGQAKLGIPFVKRALRLDPRVPRNPYLNILAVCQFHAGLYQDALETEKSNRERGGPHNAGIQAHVVAAHALLGQREKAKQQYELLKRTSNKFDWKTWLRRTFKDEQSVEEMLRTIRKLSVQ
jgi:adenylate cyclase